MEPTKEIEQLVRLYTEAIHSQSEADFKALWSGEDTNALISGTKFFEGLDAIYQTFLIGLIQKKYSSIHLVNDGLQSYQLTEDTAVVIFRYHTDCVIRESGQPYGMAGIETQVLKKIEGSWKIAHIQYHGKDIAN